MIESEIEDSSDSYEEENIVYQVDANKKPSQVKRPLKINIINNSKDDEQLDELASPNYDFSDPINSGEHFNSNKLHSKSFKNFKLFHKVVSNL